MTAQKFKLAIGIAIIATLASLVGVLLNLQRPTAATAASATATTTSPSPSPKAGGRFGGGAPFFPGGGFQRGGGSGTVTAISGGTITLRTLSGTLTVTTTSSTTYSKEGQKISLSDIKVDDVLQVRPVRASGSSTPSPSPTPPTTITAQSIDVVMPSFFGRVTSVSGPTIFIVTTNGQEAFVFTTSSTKYSMNNAAAALSDVKAGDYVGATGTQTDLKHLTADQVTISTSAGPKGGPRFGGGPPFGGGAPFGGAPFRPHAPASPTPSGTAT